MKYCINRVLLLAVWQHCSSAWLGKHTQLCGVHWFCSCSRSCRFFQVLGAIDPLSHFDEGLSALRRAARVPYCNVVCGDGLHGAPVEVEQQLFWKLCFLSGTSGSESLKTFLGHCCCVNGPWQIPADLYFQGSEGNCLPLLTADDNGIVAVMFQTLAVQ